MSLRACWVPGLPHLLKSEKSPAWTSLSRAYSQLGEELNRENPDVLILYSTQWISVLGTSFQAHPNPKGCHTDDNWYEWGDLPFDLKVDSALAADMSKRVPASRTVSFDGFPIDTGTLVAMKFLNPLNRPVVLVSSGVYCDAQASYAIGREVSRSLEASGKKGIFVACSLLSARYFTEEIDPVADKISSASDDEWNRKILAGLEVGDLNAVAEVAPQYSKEALADMQFNAFHWMRGTLADTQTSGRVLGYGPIWGTGAAVIGFLDR
jgi:2-aminophenol/2-amino-5-chlorophenol 1,6-dioxygenase subunit alpha